MRTERIAQQVADRVEWNLHFYRGTFDSNDARVRRKLRQKCRRERGFSDAHFADDCTTRDGAACATTDDGLVIRGMQIRFLDVASDEIARQIEHLREALFA